VASTVTVAQPDKCGVLEHRSTPWLTWFSHVPGAAATKDRMFDVRVNRRTLKSQSVVLLRRQWCPKTNKG
jgi:hypothetical protein